MSERSAQPLISTTTILSGVVVGLVHAGIAAILWNQWFDNLGELLAIKPLEGLYVGLGMFLLGFVPAVFYAGRKILSPAIIVAVLLVLSVVGSWVAGPVRAPSVSPAPFGLYILFWVGIVVLVGLSGRLELRRKQRAVG